MRVLNSATSDSQTNLEVKFSGDPPLMYKNHPFHGDVPADNVAGWLAHYVYAMLCHFMPSDTPRQVHGWISAVLKRKNQFPNP